MKHTFLAVLAFAPAGAVAQSVQAPIALVPCDSAAVRSAQRIDAYRQIMVLPTFDGEKLAFTVTFKDRQDGSVDTATVTISGSITKRGRAALMKALAQWHYPPHPCSAPVERSLSVTSPGGKPQVGYGSVPGAIVPRP